MKESTCAKCGERPAGPGRILCPQCKKMIEDHMLDHAKKDAS